MRTKNVNKYYPYLIISLILVFNILSIKCESPYIYFPLKSKDATYIQTLKDISDIMKFIYLEPLISEIIIGTPEQKANFIFRTDCSYFYLTNKNHKVSKPDSTSELIQKKFGDFSYYNPDKSDSVNYFENIKNYTYAYDNQYTSKLIKEKIKIKDKECSLNITVAEKIELEEPGAICLQILEDKDKGLLFTPSFIVSLKEQLNLINIYKWFIYYSEDNNNYLVIGASPNEVKNPKTGNLLYPEYDKEKNYGKINDILGILNKREMKLKFDDIYLIDNNNDKTEIHFEDNKNFFGKLIPNIGFIVGTKDYSNYVEKNIFEKYLNNNKCKKGKFNQRPDLTGQEYEFYYCEESLYDTMKSLYNKIIFKHTALSENFELDFNDVFIKQNKYLIFLIIFSTHEHFYWSLGKPFMKKYQFEFDFENKYIGYYKIQKKENNNKNKENNENDNSLKYILISIGVIILAGILITLGIIIGKYYFKMRKKRANELEDDFDYQQKKDSNPTPIINDNE